MKKQITIEVGGLMTMIETHTGVEPVIAFYRGYRLRCFAFKLMSQNGEI